MPKPTEKNIHKRSLNFLEKAKSRYGNKYDYTLVKYVNTITCVNMVCSVHGVFSKTPATHLAGGGCKKCSMEVMAAERTFSKEKVIDKFRAVHGDRYEYDLSDYKNYTSKVGVVCKQHGKSFQDASNHLRGKGCRGCFIDRNTDTLQDFIRKSKKVHKGYYTYLDSIYQNTYSNVEITCPKHGNFKQRANDHVKGHRCPSCSGRKSQQEVMWQKFLDDRNIKYLENRRPSWLTLDGGKASCEIDIYIPSLDIALEVNGNMYHSTSSVTINSPKDISYHFEKYVICKANGIELIHIFQFESVKEWKKMLTAYIDDPKSHTITYKNNKRQYKEFDFYGQSFIKRKQSYQ